MNDPLFIMYSARSGSTYFARILAERLGITIPPESNFVTRLLANTKSPFRARPTDSVIADDIALDRTLDIICNEQKFTHWGLSRSLLRDKLSRARGPLNLRRVVHAVLDAFVEVQANHSSLVAIKKGSYLKWADTLKVVFPKAGFIGLIRDGRAVFNSQRQSICTTTNTPFETDPIRSAGQWCDIVRRIRHLQASDSTRALILQYENVVREPETVLQQVESFTGKCQTRDGHVEYHIPLRYKKLHANVHRDPLLERIDAWQHELSPRAIADFEKVAARTLLQEGYALYTDHQKGRLDWALDALREWRRVK